VAALRASILWQKVPTESLGAILATIVLFIVLIAFIVVALDVIK
jgi:hypothetical protein